MTCYVVLALLPDSPGNKYTSVLVALPGTFRKKHLQQGIKKEGELWFAFGKGMTAKMVNDSY